MAKDKDVDVKEIPMDPDQELREMFFDGNYDETMSFEEFKARGIGKRADGSPPHGEMAIMRKSRGGRSAVQGTKFRGVR